MKRRAFFKNITAGSAGIILLPDFAIGTDLNKIKQTNWDLMEKNFLHPPDSTRPWVFWMWMNGNITKEGITLDLEAMKRMGIGGAICFNSAVGIPRGPVDYASPEWMMLTLHAVAEADRLGLQISLHNSPGYSGTGGPWVTPEMSMQQLVWTETQLKDLLPTVSVQLPQPFARMGFYRDAFVLAYPSLPVENGLMQDKLIRVLANGKEIIKSILFDGNSLSKIRIEPISGQPATLLFEFAEPFEARSITLTRKAEIPHDLFDGPRDHPPRFVLETSGNGIDFVRIASFSCPELREMDTPAMQNFAKAKGTFYRLVTSDPTWISGVELHAAPRLAGWPGKTSWTHGNSGANEPDLEESLLIDPKSVIDLTAFMDKNGELKWKAPKKGNLTILRIGHTTTGEENAAHPDAGKGLEIDKFRKEALDYHLEKFSMPLVNRLKKYKGKSFVGLTTDSWEAGKQNWSINFPEEFRKRRKYSLMQWMLAMTGRIVGNIAETERFLWDMRKTQSELLSENYYSHWKEWCHQQGLQYHSEPYGDGNFDSLEIGQHLDVPMAEFWSRYIYGSDVTSKQAASLAHVYGRPVAAAEAFTGMPATSKWTDYPYSLKAEGDWFFTLGINRLVFHTFVHQPYTSGLPGMTMGPFGSHFDRNNTWTEQAYGWTEYLQRTQYLLQQGLTVADVCYFIGDEPQSGVPDVYPLMPDGIVADVVGRDALFNRFTIQDNRILLPDGMSYRLCLLPSVKAILPDTLSRIKELVQQGMILVVSIKPDKSLGLSGTDEEVKKITEELFGNLDGVSIKQVQTGKGKVFWGNSISEVLDQISVQPDFLFSSENQDAAIHFTHKTFGNHHLYFVSNHRRRNEKIVCSFRVEGLLPEIWNSETGEITTAISYNTVEGSVQLPLELEPAGSFFILFRKKAKVGKVQEVRKDGMLLFSAKAFEKPVTGIFADVQNNFSIALWAKPDTFAHGGRSMLFHPSDGETAYGPGHSVCGLGAGQNGVFVYERSRGRSLNIGSFTGTLEGWTHLVLVYSQGVPVLFVNGIKVVQGRTSGNIVHPGLETQVSLDQLNSFFEGNFTKPELYRQVLTEQAIRNLFERGLPDGQLLSPAKFLVSQQGKSTGCFLANGTYEIVLSSGKREEVAIRNCSQKLLDGSWTIRFPKGNGAPEQIEVPVLVSLIRHKDFNVRHFSGTCSYHKKVSLTAEDFMPGRKFFLDLGRVEVIAKVMVNNKQAGIYWKEPFVADITEFVRQGENDIQVEVTNLWVNRLIGDENLPVENEYSKDRFILKLPEWYRKNLPKPGGRITFSVWHNLEKTDPLLESGLLGPVRLILGEEKFI